MKPGRREGAGPVRGTEVLKKGTEVSVKADDGTYLELDGKLGTIFKSEAVLSSHDPNALPSDGITWKAGTMVFQRQPDVIWAIERRSEKNVATVKLNWRPKTQPTVRTEGEDGTVLLTDGETEGWMKKSQLVTREDVPEWAERRLKVAPKDWSWLWVRAELFNSDAKYPQAEAEFSAAIKLDSKTPALYGQRGYVRYLRGDLDGAIADFTEAARLQPEDKWPLAYRGSCWLLKREYQKAEDDLTAWLDERPDSAAWLDFRADARMHLRKAIESLADANASLKIVPNLAYPLRLKARALAKLQKHSDAKEVFEQVMELERPVSLYVEFAKFLAVCPDERIRDGGKAVHLMKLTQAAFETAKNELPAEYLEVFAAAYAEAGEYDEAVSKQGEAIDKLKSDKKTPAAELKRAEVALELYKKNKPLRDE